MTAIETTIGREKNGDFSHVVAREGSELARCLTRRGWRATLGWRSQTNDGSVWLVRFEPAEESAGRTDLAVGSENVSAGLSQAGS